MKVARFVIAACALSSAAAFANDSASPQSQSSDNGSSAQNYSQSSSSQSGDQNLSQVQQALKQKGFDPGPVDGKMGPKTQAALTQFQQSKQLDASGQADSQTLAALGVQGGSGLESNSSSAGSASIPSSPSSSTTPSTSSSSTTPSTSSTSSDTSQQSK